MRRLLIVLICTLLTACSQHEGKNEIKVGTIAGPETTLMQVAAKVALKRYGLHVNIVNFSDYILPNQACHDGDIDANAFQHLPYLIAQNKARGYHLVSVGKTLLYPMGLYSKRLSSLKQLKSGAQVAIPNDPSNEARALLLLQKVKLIALKNKGDITSTVADIVKNPLGLQFIAVDAAELPRSLSDVSIAAINTNYAVGAGLNLSQALASEGTDSPYVNIIAVTPKLAHSKKVTELVRAYQSPAVAKAAKRLFGQNAIIGWKNN